MSHVTAEYWRIIELANNHSSLQLNLPAGNEVVVKKLEQATKEYLLNPKGF